MPKKRAKSSKVVNKNNRTINRSKHHNLDSKNNITAKPTAKNNVKIGFNLSFPTQTPQQPASFHHFPNQIIQPTPIHVPYVIPQVSQPSDLLRQSLQKEVSQINLPKPVQIQPAKSSVDTIQDEKAEVIFPEDEKEIEKSKKKRSTTPEGFRSIPLESSQSPQAYASQRRPEYVEMKEYTKTQLNKMSKADLYNEVSQFSDDMEIVRMNKSELIKHYLDLYKKHK